MKTPAIVSHVTSAMQRLISKKEVPMKSVAADLPVLHDAAVSGRVETLWRMLADEFETAYAAMPAKAMTRTELTFHPYIKLLGYLSLDLANLPGDILEIGVWKGRSLALMERLSPAPAKVIGVDPCAFAGQEAELRYFHTRLFARAHLIVTYSERAAADVLRLSQTLKLLHIDGGHETHHVWADFLLYRQFIVPGGYVVFDDYADDLHSPGVRIAVDDLRRLGMFDGFEIIGPVRGYENSFLLRKSSAAAAPRG